MDASPRKNDTTTNREPNARFGYEFKSLALKIQKVLMKQLLVQ